MHPFSIASISWGPNSLPSAEGHSFVAEACSASVAFGSADFASSCARVAFAGAAFDVSSSFGNGETCTPTWIMLSAVVSVVSPIFCASLASFAAGSSTVCCMGGAATASTSVHDRGTDAAAFVSASANDSVTAGSLTMVSFSIASISCGPSIFRSAEEPTTDCPLASEVRSASAAGGGAGFASSCAGAAPAAATFGNSSFSGAGVMSTTALEVSTTKPSLM
mmetsp:Transcript_82388/g.163468  ORF Transcript_82388/g.163468 Transcript_82388/m.163468 type:complete len:221 (+) Transcript_82388:430-1092(+)